MNPLLLSGIFDIGKSLISRFFPDPTQAAEANMKLLAMQQNGELAQLAAETDLAKLQISVNVEEAKNTNMFVAGWRPFVGWVCGVAFAYVYMGLPFLQFLVYTWGSPVQAAQLAKLPAVDITTMMPVLLGMLGLGGLRSLEKVKNVEGNR